MKNREILYLVIFLFFSSLHAEELVIQSKNITLEKDNQVSIFENEVEIITSDQNIIKSDYAEYDKTIGFIKLKNNIVAKDKDNNIIKSDYAEYNEKKKLLKSLGPTLITTSENYIIEGKNISLDDTSGSINSEEETIITDQDNNKIYLQNFSYQKQDYIFKSIGNAKLEDNMGNIYEFSQIYINTKTKEVMATDAKFFFNSEDAKFDERNKPRIFSNWLKIANGKTTFNKSICTFCDYREEDKSTPWAIQSSKILHDNKKKTIYYDNAIIKIYNIPVLYFPKLSHPDPSVERRSGFLIPTMGTTKNLGTGVSLPYFKDLGKDKNLTLTPRIYLTENPLLLGEYHQKFKNSNLITDFGYTAGYKKGTSKKPKGDKNHLFARFEKKFLFSEERENLLNLNVQHVSNDKYLKLYKIDSQIIDYETNVLENSLDFTSISNDSFLGFNASIYENIGGGYNDRYEFILPEITFDKNLLNDDEFGNLNFQTNYKVHNYDTNKYTNSLINSFNWNYKDILFESGLNGKILGNIKNINYENKNVDYFKDEATSELFGAIGYLTELPLFKKKLNTSYHLKPKLLVRYAPGSMRKDLDGFTLNPMKAFSIDRLEENNNFETGLSSTIGLDYTVKNKGTELDFSVAQIINEKENKKMSSKTSLDEKVSDLVGDFNYQFKNFNLNYDFAVDQNYNELNYSEIGAGLNYENINVNFGYLQENKHIGDKEYFKTKIQYNKSDNALVSFETKRNLVSDSSEFYNLSYEYLNDCLRAGLFYRREFYNDSELDQEHSLMFKVTLTPFGDINSPSFTP